MGAFLAVGAHFADYSLGTLPFAAELVGLGAVGVAIYSAYVLTTEQSVRRMTRVVLSPVLGRPATSDE
jgi:hypothetical protein